MHSFSRFYATQVLLRPIARRSRFPNRTGLFPRKAEASQPCLHGHGTVCGLEVIPEPREPECEPHSTKDTSQLKTEIDRVDLQLSSAEKSGNTELVDVLRSILEEKRRRREDFSKTPDCEDLPPTRVLVHCGLALDCEGNELVVRHSLCVDLWQELSPEDRQRVNPQGQSLYISLCYCPLPLGPMRPVLVDACGATSECHYGKVRDSVRAKVTVDKPEEDERCETCCTACCDPCLLVARINNFIPGHPLTADQVDNDVRRMIGPYSHVKITGISWTHGAEYNAQEAKSILGTNDLHGGIRVDFSGTC